MQPDPSNPRADDTFLTMRQAVMEIRDDVKTLASHLDRIDREGSIGTKAELEDHEKRLRIVETTGLRMSSAWATIGLSASFIVALAGVAAGATSLLFH